MAYDNGDKRFAIRQLFSSRTIKFLSLLLNQACENAVNYANRPPYSKDLSKKWVITSLLIITASETNGAATPASRRKDRLYP